MQARAAVLFGAGEDWQVETIDLDPPRAGEVLVAIRAAGVCHSDEHMRKLPGLPPEVRDAVRDSLFPTIGGHEGAGEVLEVGEGVRSVRPGDHVAMSFIPTCGHCHYCTTGRGNLCDNGATLMLKGSVHDGTARHHLAGADLNLTSKLGTWATHTVVAESSVIPIDAHIRFDVAALVSCGVSTGFGAAVDRGGVRPGETVAVIGVGGVGINAVQGARIAGATHVLGIDPVAFKRDQALTFGATAVAPTVAEAAPALAAMTHGAMADVVVITVGEIAPENVGEALSLAGKDGRVVLTSMGSTTEQLVPLNLFELSMWNKAILGTVYGSRDPRNSVPELLRLYRKGQLKLDELITKRYSLDEVVQANRAMLDGEVLRAIIEPS
jgi:NDMA-dependent alcohol dehydrogenase